MCNLSQGIEEKGFDRGVNTMIISMYGEGYTFEQVSKVAKISVDEVKKIIQKNEPVMA